MAGSSVIGALRVTLGLDSANFTTGAKKAETRAEQLGLKIGRSLRSATGEVTAFAKAFTSLGAIAGGAALGALAARGLEYASSLAEVAQQLGVTTKDLQEYRYAASQVGISQEEIDKGLAKLTVSMGKARADGISPAGKAFKELSDILGKDVLKGAATAGDAIPLIADALAKVKDPAARAALEVALFGKAGQKLDTLLAGGSSAVDELTKAARDLGIVLSDEQIQNADKTADKLSELQQVLEARIAGAVADNAQSIYDLANSFVTLTSSILDAVGAAARFRKLSVVDSGRSVSARLAADIPTMLVGKLKGQSRDQISEEAAFSLTKGSRADRQALLTKTAQEYNSSRDPAERSYLRSRQQSILKEEARQKRASRTPPAGASSGAGAGVSDAARSSDASRAAAAAARADRERQRAAEQALADQRRYEQQLGQTNSDYLSAQADLSVSASERAQFESDRLQAESVAQLEAIRLDKDLNEAQKAKLSALVSDTSALRETLIGRRREQELAQQSLESALSSLSNDEDILQAQAGLARTSKERGRIELLILDKQFEALKIAEQAIIDNKGKNNTPQQIKDANDRLRTLGTLQGAARVKSARDNAGPLQKYFDEIPRGADEVNEALQRISADGLGTLIDGLANVEGGFKGLADTVSNVANQIISSLLKIGLQKGISALFGALFPSVGGHSVGGVGITDSLFGKLSAGNGVTGPSIAGARAGGGPVIGGKSYLVGERGHEIFTPSVSGRIIANDDIGTGGGRFIIEPSPWFDVRAAGAALPGIQSMGVRAAAGGAQIAQTKADKAARRRLGG